VLTEKVDALEGLSQAEGESGIVVEVVDGVFVAGLEQHDGVGAVDLIVHVLQLAQLECVVVTGGHRGVVDRSILPHFGGGRRFEI